MSGRADNEREFLFRRCRANEVGCVGTSEIDRNIDIRHFYLERIATLATRRDHEIKLRFRRGGHSAPHLAIRADKQNANLGFHRCSNSASDLRRRS